MGSRRILGHAIGEHHDAELACGALAMAVAVRGGSANVAGVVFHSDYAEVGVKPENLRMACSGRVC
jgi:transposase InsO family protein